MENPEYQQLLKDNKAIDMVRPFYTHKNDVKPKDVTVVICQGNKRSLTELCLSSLLRFYPDIDVLVVNGSPFDYDSTNYLKLMALKHSNVRVLEWAKSNSHGVMMDTSIRNNVSNEYVLLMDNDTIVERGGWIEPMVEQLESNPNMFATGTLMVVSMANDSCGIPHDADDVLRHAHPSCSILKRSMYLGFRGATDHGAPLCYTMADAKLHGREIGSFPIDQYVSHLSGASWTMPRTIWNNDHDVPKRPFITFIVSEPTHISLLNQQSDHDFDLVPLGSPIVDNVVIHDGEPSKDINNRLFDLRFRVMGEYVCFLPPDLTTLTSNYVAELRQHVVERLLPDRIYVGGLESIKRTVWQGKDCFE